MTLDLDDTIVAIASAAGGAARGVVRVSGADSARCLASVFEPARGRLGESPAAQCRDGQLQLPRGLGKIPARLYLWPDGRSYTRQPAGELHLVGSPPLLDAALAALCAAGARLARPGEFTLRAFLAGRLDLTQAEAVLGVIDAREGPQLKAALAQLAGGLASPLAMLRERLLDLLAHLEAGLDFVEEDIEFIAAADLRRQLDAAAEQVADVVAQMQGRRDGAELPRVVLVGRPNAGKSSLLNSLVGRQAAIVSDAAGTTRDYVTAPLTIDSAACLLVDTAGSDAAAAVGDWIAAGAQQAAQRQRQEADATILCLAATDRAPPDRESHDLLVWTKCDLAPAPLPGGICTSSRTGQGIAELRSAIASRLAARTSDTVVASTAARCRESLSLTAEALRRAAELAAHSAGEELIAAEVRTALDGLGQVVGAVYTDDVLDRVFSRFCIGK